LLLKIPYLQTLFDTLQEEQSKIVRRVEDQRAENVREGADSVGAVGGGGGFRGETQDIVRAGCGGDRSDGVVGCLGLRVCWVLWVLIRAMGWRVQFFVSRLGIGSRNNVSRQFGSIFLEYTTIYSIWTQAYIISYFVCKKGPMRRHRKKRLLCRYTNLRLSKLIIFLQIQDITYYPSLYVAQVLDIF